MNHRNTTTPLLKTTFLKKFFLGFFVLLFFFAPVITPLSQNNDLQIATVHAQGASKDVECGVANSFLTGGGTIQGCIVDLAYYVIYYPASLFLYFTGLFFDVIAPITLSSTVIEGDGIVDTGWEMIRGLVNSVFIFIVLYIAISLILQVGARDAKRTLVTLIIVALLVNFSLFFSKIIIDASNVMAIQFYQTIGEVKGGPNTEAEPLTIRSALDVSERTLSAAVANGLSPQQLIDGDTWDSFANSNAADGSDKDPDVSSFLFLFLVAAVLNLMAAVAFFAAGAILIARVVILWFLMILSPIAFAAFILPKTRGQAQKWLSMLLSQSFVAPVFFLLFYILITFIDNDSWSQFFVDGDAAEGLVPRLVVLSLIGAFYILLLMFITGITVRFSSAAGGAGTKFGKIVAGSAVGGYVGAYAAGGRQTIGRGARAVANQKDANGETRASRWKQRGGFAKYGAYGLERTAKSSFDTRNTRAGMAGAGAAGIGNTVGKGQQGGFEKSVQDRVQEQKNIEAGIINPESRNDYRRKIENESAIFRTGGSRKASQTAREFQQDVQRQEAQYKSLQSPEAKAEFISRADTDIGKKLYEDESGYERAKLEKALSGLIDQERKKGTEEGDAIAERLESTFEGMQSSIENREQIASGAPEDLQSISYGNEQDAQQKEKMKGRVQLARDDYAKADGKDDSEAERTKALNALENDDEKKELFKGLSPAAQDQFINEGHGGADYEETLSEEEKRKLNNERQKNAELQEKVTSQQASKEGAANIQRMDHEIGNADSEEIKNTVKSMGQGITELEDGLIRRNDVMESLTNTQLAALQKQGKMSDATIDAIRNKYEQNPGSMTQSAQNYFTHSPARMHFGMSDGSTQKTANPQEPNNNQT